MASLTKLSLLSLAFILVLLSSIIQGGEAEVEDNGAFSHAGVDSIARKLIVQSPSPTPTPKIDCSSACAFRCSKAQEHDNCLHYCGICCDKCQCVPPGTYGNREACGTCYASWYSHGRPKCP